MGNLFTYKCLIRRDLANTYTHTPSSPSKKDIFILYILSEQKIVLYLLNSTVAASYVRHVAYR
jgi:hypothetical protein